jgi:hypothetical protein
VVTRNIANGPAFGVAHAANRALRVEPNQWLGASE